MVRFAALVVAALLLASLSHASAQVVPTEGDPSVQGSTLVPSDTEMKQHTYRRLYKDPLRAFGYEALFPGAGSFYDGIHLHAAVSLSLSVVGAALWATGALLERDNLWWSGAVTFGIGRTFGLIAAPVGAALLNAAFRRQLGIAYRF